MIPKRREAAREESALLFMPRAHSIDLLRRLLFCTYAAAAQKDPARWDSCFQSTELSSTDAFQDLSFGSL
jgi:hypothetical protein